VTWVKRNVYTVVFALVALAASAYIQAHHLGFWPALVITWPTFFLARRVDELRFRLAENEQRFQRIRSISDDIRTRLSVR
jgi:hypothetical protein